MFRYPKPCSKTALAHISPTYSLFYLLPEQFKAWSQNLGHEKVLTTFVSYGNVSCQRQGEIIRDLAEPQREPATNAEEIAEAVIKKLHSYGVNM
ncbi:MAG: hypothetical protein CVU64_19905 [Deltaproteobacteria bacterium HGW-Deltaproteobacteria-21]|nr:MAG: hypothetical protein CVU64_19905 [Deltaproteobacteria bacterium HGW-Deltaproteobacteria-21]